MQEFQRTKGCLRGVDQLADVDRSLDVDLAMDVYPLYACLLWHPARCCIIPVEDAINHPCWGPLGILEMHQHTMRNAVSLLFIYMSSGLESQ